MFIYKIISLKPENVLIDVDGYIKITDFGLSKRGIIGNEGAYSKCGTPEYFAPEILCEESHGKAADWWTFGTFILFKFFLGLIIYELIFGEPAYSDPDRKQLYKKIINDPLPHLSQLNPLIRFFINL